MSPLLQQLRQGATPAGLATSVAWGFMLGIFPILGTTTTLCAVAGVLLRLNHVAVQTVNWLVYPLQLILVIPYLQLGNWMFGLDPMPLSIKELTAMFEADFLGAWGELGGLALRGVAAWAVTAVPVIAFLSMVLRPVFRRLAGSLPRREAAP